MPLLKEQVATLFDLLSEQEQVLVYELIQRLVPDDVASKEDAADIASAREEYRNGETADMSAIYWG